MPGSELSWHDILATDEPEDSETTDAGERLDVLQGLVALRSEKHATVLRLRRRGLSMAEIGDVLGVSESRVSQILVAVAKTASTAKTA